MLRIALLLIALIFSLDLYAGNSQNSIQTPAKNSNPIQQQITHTKGSSDVDKNIPIPSISGLNPAKPDIYSNESQRQTLKEPPFDNLITWFTGLLVLVGAIQAFFFFVQLKIMRSGIRDATTAANAATMSADASKKSADIAELTMRVGGRAFVYAIRIMPFWEDSTAKGEYNWRFRPELKNTGATPTKNMTMHTQCELRDSPRPVEFNFDYPTTEIWRGFLPPQVTNNGTLAPRPPSPAITPADIIDIQNGRKVLYFWGWIRYNDVFEGTSQHITRFSWTLSPIGDPRAYIPNQRPESLIWNYFLTPDGNCADEECTQYNNQNV